MNFIIRVYPSAKTVTLKEPRKPLYIVNDYFSDDSLLSEIVTKDFRRAYIFKEEGHVEQYMRNHMRRIFELEDATILKLTDEELFLSRLKDDL